MLNDEVGKNFLNDARGRISERGEPSREAVKILVVDGVLGSRFSLVQAASQPGFLVDACPTVDEALRQLDRADYSLVIADERIGREEGLRFLETLSEHRPETARALVAEDAGLDWKRSAIERADLCFLLTKPWSTDALRRTLRELFSDERRFEGWEQLDAPTASDTPEPSAPASDRIEFSSRQEVLVRGLLAGLNSCESELEVFELLRSELAEPFGTSRWLWIDEDRRSLVGLNRDWSLDEALDPETLSETERALLTVAARSSRVARLDAEGEVEGAQARRTSCLGVPLRIGGRRTLTGIVWAEDPRAASLVSVLRELVDGLQMAILRIREADARASAARELARRVSAELRMPVGALAHAVDVLRGEAARAGLPIEWVDRVQSESERVVRAVEHLEGEMLAAPRGANVTTG